MAKSKKRKSNPIDTTTNDGDDQEDVGDTLEPMTANNMWSNLAWEKVNVSAASEIDSKDSSSKSDVIVNAMFFGLEVIDGSKYAIQHTKLKSSKKDENQGTVTTVVPIDPTTSATANTVDTINDSKKQGESNTLDLKSIPPSPKYKLSEAAMQKQLAKKEKSKAKAKLKKEKKKKALANEAAATNELIDFSSSSLLSNPKVHEIRTLWAQACQNSIWLHPVLAYGLSEMKFMSPTPIQSSTLPASILGRRNIVGAAATGSGKTLSFALPILQYLLEEKDEEHEQLEAQQQQQDEQTGNQKLTHAPQKGLRALITCPTRELALQVSKEIKTVCKNQISVGTIVGGLAEQKQKRVLDKVQPSILVATPGRLWELMSSEDHPHLQDMNYLRFLVIDEADRMISQGNFPQLKQIFNFIQQHSPQPPGDDSDSGSEDDSTDSDDDSDSDDEDRMQSLQGVRGEAKVKMLDDDILQQIEQQRLGEAPRPLDEYSQHSSDDEEEEEQLNYSDAQLMDLGEHLDDNIDADKESFEEVKYVPRQTFIYSATLTLPSTMIRKEKPTNKKKKKGGKAMKNTVEGAIADILEQAGAIGQTKVVDLTSEKNEEITKNNKDKIHSSSTKDETKVDVPATNNKSKRLPPGLSLYQIQCTQKHKDSHCYAYLATTQQGSSGPCLIFCNSISGVRRVGTTLQTLGLPVRMLHAQMQQKARFASLESLKKPGSRAIVVATDVAARGLDIPSVSTVIHYDTARTVDTFIHRAGRTARGVGEKAVGTSISLVAPGEDEKKHVNVCRALQGSSDTKKFEEAVIDGHLLRNCQERAALATKIVNYEESEAKTNQKNKWFIDAANDAGIDLDDDLLEDGMLDNGDKRDRMRAKGALQAKSQLRELLAKPMRIQNFGKFLSGAGMAAAVKKEAAVTPFVVKDTNNKSNKGSKKKKKKDAKKRKTDAPSASKGDSAPSKRVRA